MVLKKKEGVKVALFHPWIKSRGGAERVVLDFLKNTSLEVDLYTWAYDKDNTFEEFQEYNIKVVAPKIAKRFSRSYILRGLFLPLSLFSKIPLENYDKFFISTGGLAELITLRNYKKGETYAYVHTILRASYKEDVEWNLRYRYKSPLGKTLYLLAGKFYRFFERISWRRIDVPIFNSELSLKRAQNHKLIKNKKSFVIYPSVNVSEFEKLKGVKKGFFLYVARFGVAKRQLELLAAWKNFVRDNPSECLILVGNKENKEYFEAIEQQVRDTRNVEIKTNLPQKELYRLYENSKAVLFVPFMEDFGIVPFEAMAAGKPLILVNRGGYVDLVKENYPKGATWIKDSNEREILVENIEKGLQKFCERQVKGKKTKISGLDEKIFTKRIEEILR